MFMDIAARVMRLAGVKSSRLLDRLEDPVEALSLDQARLDRALVQAGEDLAEVAGRKNGISRRLAAEEAQARMAQADADLAVRSGRDDLAREAITRKLRHMGSCDLFRETLAQVDSELGKLVSDRRNLEQVARDFRDSREALEASGSVARARAHAVDHAAGVGRMGGATLALEKARDRVMQLTGRADGLNEMIGSGEMGIDGGHRDGGITRLRTEAQVEAELQAMKDKAGKVLASNPSPRLLEAPRLRIPNTIQVNEG